MEQPQHELSVRQSLYCFNNKAISVERLRIETFVEPFDALMKLIYLYPDLFFVLLFKRPQHTTKSNEHKMFGKTECGEEKWINDH